MYELLWLLLPVAALSGWWTAKRGIGISQRSNDEGLNTEYFKGLHYLLNEQKDKAIEVFLQIVEADGEMIETHLALGNLFRQRGEVDRAIRVHQNLIDRPSLNNTLRGHALLELAKDYMRAGLLDRAEHLFYELIELGLHRRQANRYLIDIYEQERDWQKAIETAINLEKVANVDECQRIAHYYCELADEAWNRKDVSRFFQNADQAIASDAECVRASLLKGNAEFSLGNYQDAINIFRRVEQQDADYLPEVLESLKTAYQLLGREKEFRAYLHQLVEHVPRTAVILVLAEVIFEQEGVDAAVEYVVNRLRSRPSIQSLAWLTDKYFSQTHVESGVDFRCLQEMSQKLLHGRAVYSCVACGFSGRLLHWHCPGCKQWATIKPVLGVEGE